FNQLRDFHEKLSDLGHSTNIATLVPQGNVRLLSSVGLSKQEPTNDQLGEMRGILEDNLNAGAFGMSTGLIYPPGSITSTDELIELGKSLKEFDGLYVSHIRNESSGIIKAIQEAIRIGSAAGVPVHVSHLKVAFNSFLTKKVLKLIERMQASGIDMTADAYPYVAGSTNLGSIVLPPWVFSGGGRQIKEILMDDNKREQIIKESLARMLDFANVPPSIQKLLPKFVIKLGLGVLSRKVMITATKNNKRYQGKYLHEIIKTEFKDEKDMFHKVLRLLAEEEGSVTMAIFQENETRTLIPILKAPFVMLGTDGIHGHPRTWGTYPRFLGRYVRDMGIISIPEAIYKMTGMAAQRLGLKDRGFIREGYHADIVIFDLNKIKDNSTYDNWTSKPSGIIHVLVNGKLTVKDGMHAGVKNGLVLKRACDIVN
ncbi:MAG: N-acyl-D-amino-acid deacylase family protein, partial [Promethearchaeota archaeon]